MERQLLHAQKLDSLGVLAGGIAHDFNNLLAVILSNIELAMSDLPTTSPVQDVLMDALLGGKRAAELTRQMLAYSGRGRFVTSEMDVSKLARDLGDLLKVSISKSVRLNMELTSELPPIQADAAQLQQVLMNLVTNASEAIGDQPGTITVTTSVRDCDAAFLKETRTANKSRPGRYVVLEVRTLVAEWMRRCGRNSLILFSRPNLSDADWECRRYWVSCRDIKGPLWFPVSPAKEQHSPFCFRWRRPVGSRTGPGDSRQRRR